MLSSKVLIICVFLMVVSTVLALSERSSVLPSDTLLSDYMQIQDKIQNFEMKYYYIDIRLHQQLSIEFYSDGIGTHDILMRELSKPTDSIFDQRYSIESNRKKMESAVQSNTKRIWVGVKSVNGKAGTVNFRVRTPLVDSPTPTPTPKPNPNPIDCNCKNEIQEVSYGLAPIIGLTVPSIVISLSLLIVIIVQFKKMNETSKKITELERKLQSLDNSDREMPVMKIPLLEDVQNNSSQEETIQNQQYPIVYQLPNQMYPQMIQNQANAQPMVFVPQQQVVNQQPLSNTQSKQ